MFGNLGIELLNQAGIDAVAHPREGISPLTVCLRPPPTVWRRLRRRRKPASLIGSLTHLLAPGFGTPPAVEPDLIGAPLEGKATRKVALEGGLKLLSEIAALMGAPGVNLRGAFSAASQVEFVYHNVTFDHVDPAAVARYLSTVHFAPSNPYFTYVTGGAHAFLLYETLRSDAFGIVASDQSGTSLNLGLDGIQQALGAGAALAASKADQFKIVFQGRESLCFGVKGFRFQLHNDHGWWRPRVEIPDVIGGVATGAPQAPEPELIAPRALLDFDAPDEFMLATT